MSNWGGKREGAGAKPGTGGGARPGAGRPTKQFTLKVGDQLYENSAGFGLVEVIEMDRGHLVL